MNKKKTECGKTQSQKHSRYTIILVSIIRMNRYSFWNTNFNCYIWFLIVGDSDLAKKSCEMSDRVIRLTSRRFVSLSQVLFFVVVFVLIQISTQHAAGTLSVNPFLYIFLNQMDTLNHYDPVGAKSLFIISNLGAFLEIQVKHAPY